MSMYTESGYMAAALPERLAHVQGAARLFGRPTIFKPRAARPAQPGRLEYLDDDHGLRVVLADTVANLRQRGWYVDRHQDETTQGALIRLPHRRGFLLAATDPWQDGALTILRGELEDYEDDPKDAARRADRFAELLAEDYRDDAEHREALDQHEEQAAPLIAALTAARADARDAVARQCATADALANARNALAAVQGIPSGEAYASADMDALAAAYARACTDEQRALARADEIQEELDALEPPTPPRFNYFPNP